MNKVFKTLPIHHPLKKWATYWQLWLKELGVKRKDDFELESAKKLVKEYISDLMVLTKEEKEFLDRFENGEYIPELLFDDKEILDRIKNHPMAIWKTR